ncbi:hypothetical protein SAMN02194393_05238 [Maledivibacter halophilus]|uniref:Uncharacterized protein n=1 Tax=Maledivibacter halophilus TaxID=36842 RepID=A0A1T5MRS1_9FIRM|nr:hypothetical protein SAMN02194393_05238 [Maledivibacter halophilus]
MIIKVDFVLAMMILLIICICLTNFFMKIANFIGDKLKIGTFFIKLFNKIGKNK